jgi:hypothetical protein
VTSEPILGRALLPTSNWQNSSSLASLKASVFGPYVAKTTPCPTRPAPRTYEIPRTPRSHRGTTWPPMSVRSASLAYKRWHGADIHRLRSGPFDLTGPHSGTAKGCRLTLQ